MCTLGYSEGTVIPKRALKPPRSLIRNQGLNLLFLGPCQDQVRKAHVTKELDIHQVDIQIELMCYIHVLVLSKDLPDLSCVF